MSLEWWLGFGWIWRTIPKCPYFILFQVSELLQLISRYPLKVQKRLRHKMTQRRWHCAPAPRYLNTPDAIFSQEILQDSDGFHDSKFCGRLMRLLIVFNRCAYKVYVKMIYFADPAVNLWCFHLWYLCSTTAIVLQCLACHWRRKFRHISIINAYNSLVGGLEHIFVPYIGNNNTNWLIFFRGVETTNQ